MPRSRREDYEGAWQHVMSRDTVFLETEVDEPTRKSYEDCQA